MTTQTGIIYCATSRTTGKQYVGQTVRSLVKRRQSHESRARKGSALVFHSAIRKYGADDFAWEILQTLPIEQLDSAETSHIEALGTYRKKAGYNIARAGGRKTMLGLKRAPFSAEHRRRISEAHKGKTIHPEHLRKLHVGHSEWTPSDQHRLAITNALKGGRHTDQARRNMSAAQTGRTFSAEHRRRLSESHKGKTGRTMSAEARQRIAEKLKGHTVSDETRRKISDALKRRQLEIS